MNKPFTFALLLAGVGLLLFGGRSVEAQVFSLDALNFDLAPPDDLFPVPGVGPPPVPILVGGTGFHPAGPVDVDAMSFGTVFPGIHPVIRAEFSVSPGSAGLAASAVGLESATGDHPADIFGSFLGGGNFQVFDGNGVATPGLAPSMGVTEPASVPPGVSNTDAWDADPLPPTALPIFFSLTPADVAAVGHPVYAGLSAADIFANFTIPGYTVVAPAPIIHAGFGALGLVFLDDIDALAIIEDGQVGFSAGDAIYFSLAPGSPTLGFLGASAADILLTGVFPIVPSIAIGAPALGLLPADDIDALHIFIPEPSTFLLCVVGLFSLGWLAWRRRMRA